MNRALLFCALATVWFSLPARLPAQQEGPKAPPPPQPPLVASPGPGSQWSVAVTFPPSAGGAPHPVSARYRSGHEVLWVAVTWSDGSLKEGYVAGSRVIFKNSAAYFSCEADGADAGLPLFCSGFAGVGWIAPGDYQGTETVEGELCHRFLKPETSTASGDRIPRRVAWVRVRDKMPFLVKLGEITFRFSPLEKASEETVIPPEVEVLLKKAQRQQEALRLLRELNAK